LKLDEKRLPQDGRFKIESDGEKVSFRVSSLPTYYGEKIVMRLLRENVSGFTLESLCFHGEGLDRIHKAVKSTTGMILTTGPTGSGKTTTLYTILDILNTPDVNISTIEDPIEYQMKRINQTQVRPEIGFTFANGLRTLVRQDPDIIMVGEIRDNETASLAVNAALTGHVVLSTLHTNSAAGAVPRLIDMKVEPFLLSSIFNLVMAQRLVRKICPNCKVENSIPADLEQRIMVELKEIPKELLGNTTNKFYKGKGCDKCNNTGYAGRTVLAEILEITQPLKDIIAKSFKMEEVRAQMAKQKFITLKQDGIIKALQGITTIEEVIRASQEL
jgi:type IV pilus assembly protein PilB